MIIGCLNPEKYDKKVKNIFNRLIQHPYQRVDGSTAQRISRIKQIRNISRRNAIDIKHGSIGIPQNVCIRKDKKKGFVFEFKY